MTESARRMRLFFGSYALLFILLAVRFTTVWLELLCLGLAVAGVVDMIRITFISARRTAPDPIRIEALADSGPEISGYLATYLLPFLTVSEPGWRSLTAYAIFLSALGLIYVRSEMTQINPTLYLFGRRIIHATTDGGWTGHIVIRSSGVQPGTEMLVASLNPAMRVEVSEQRSK